MQAKPEEQITSLSTVSLNQPDVAHEHSASLDMAITRQAVSTRIVMTIPMLAMKRSGYRPKNPEKKPLGAQRLLAEDPVDDTTEITLLRGNIAVLRRIL
jgi:hypothetical protein